MDTGFLNQRGIVHRLTAWEYAGAKPVVSYGQNAVSRTLRLTRTDPVRRKRPKPIDLPFSITSYINSRQTYTYEPCSYWYNGYGKHLRLNEMSGADFLGAWTRTANPSTPDLMNALLGKIREDVSNLANMLGEYKATANTVVHVGTNLLASVKAARKGRLGDAWKHLRDAASGSKSGGLAKRLSGGWLQYRFGIKTVLDDLEKVTQELSERLTRPVFARASKKVRANLRTTRTLGPELQCVVDVNGFVRLAACYEVNNDLLKSMSDHGMTNPASLMWELTYLSWVVDYVVGIGEWLNALDVPMTLRRSSCWETTQFVGFESAYGVGHAGYGSLYEFIHLPQGTQKWLYTSRLPRTLGAVPPRWKPSLTSIRLTNLIALGVQMRGAKSLGNHVRL